MTKSITHLREWREAADRLCADGYEMKSRRNSIVPATFTRTGHEPLYLFCPILDDRYSVVRDGWQPVINAHDPIISIPVDVVVPGKRAGRLWIAREFRSFPSLFGVREIAEHVGIAKQHAQILVQRGEIACTQIGMKRTIVVNESEILKWLQNRKKAGRPAYPDKSSGTYLRRLSKRRLVAYAKEMVAQRSIQWGVFVVALRKLGVRDVPDSESYNFWALVEDKLPRQELIELLTIAPIEE